MTSWGFLQSAVVATGAADYRHCCNTFVIVDDRFHRIPLKKSALLAL